MKAILHASAGGLALVMISVFWSATLISELFGTEEAVAGVKTGILWAMAGLIPAMMATGISGAVLGKGWRSPVVARKMRRMRIIAANGVCILLPSAVFLALRAQAGQFDVWFYGIQAVELTAGAANIWLLAQNMKDGISLSRRRTASV
ncbi:hypothetical protein [uncultured Roseibium sp.]|uniref:hypothetical protein n=1 Tax=uncultured Roseibium sp. TaxID=1936171 RepID=UPI00321768A8